MSFTDDDSPLGRCESVFTDEHLKRLKGYKNQWGNHEDHYARDCGFIASLVKDIPNLLARLEAAEAFIVDAENVVPMLIQRKSYEAWLRAKGETEQPRSLTEAELAELQRKAAEK